MKISKISTLNFFPTFVWVCDLKPEEYLPLNEALAEKIEAAIASVGGYIVGDARQSETDLQEMEDLAPLMTTALHAADQILEFLELQRCAMRVSGCWASVGGPGNFHMEHSHPNNFLSGVYYVSTPSGGDRINFHDPRPQANVMAPRVKASSAKNAQRASITVKPGSIVLFPSWLRHSVDTNTSSEMRTSIAFNLMFESFTEIQSRPRFKGTFKLRSVSLGANT